MAPTTVGRVLFNEVHEGYPIVDRTVVYDTSQTLDLDNVPLNGGILVKTLVLSVDPYMRSRMRPPSKQSFGPEYKLGEPINGHGVGMVVRSENADFKPRDHVYSIFPHAEYFVQTDVKGFRVLKNEEGLPWRNYVGVAGMPGQTAYYGWKAYANPQKGDVVFVTTAAGPVGSFVVQLAKLEGLKVIASAGSDEKVEFLKSIGADVAFNYKTTSTADVLDQHGPINIYWDHVGGEPLDLALLNAAPFARFIVCGMISTYNVKEPYGFKNIVNVIGKSITLQGFLIQNLAPRFADEFYREVPAKVARGEIKILEDVCRGLASVGQAIVDVQTGKNKGKAVVVVADE